MIIVVLRNLICLLGLFALLPLIFITIFIIYIEDGFPVIFKQKRLGLNQKQFTIYKLRTLKNMAPQLGTHEIADEYILKSGNIIRKLKLDELPQLINVLMGDLNLIGPRPGLDTQIALREARIANDIFQIKPGITGLSQVLGYDMSNPEKLSYVDKIYIQQKSMFIDILIFTGTFLSFFKKTLATKIGVSENT